MFLYIKNILLRLCGILLIILFMVALTIPFGLAFIFVGIDKTNVWMSYLCRVPMNLVFEDKTGDDLLEYHKSILKSEK